MGTFTALCLLLALLSGAVSGPAGLARAAEPDAVADAVEVGEDSSINVQALGNSTDPDGLPNTGTGADAASNQWVFAIGLAVAAGLIAFMAAASQRRREELENGGTKEILRSLG